jgi:hypothetical protein
MEILNFLSLEKLHKQKAGVFKVWKARLSDPPSLFSISPTLITIKS